MLLMPIGQAFGGERLRCEVQPTREDGREWSYRTKVGGDPRICWYPGERMKPRSELYWDTDTTRLSAPPGDACSAARQPRGRFRRARSSRRCRWSDSLTACRLTGTRPWWPRSVKA